MNPLPLPLPLPLAIPRDDAQSKMLALKEKMDKESAQHSAELKELMRVIDHNRKLKEFMAKKGRVGMFHCTEGAGLAGSGWGHSSELLPCRPGAHRGT